MYVQSRRDLKRKCGIERDVCRSSYEQEVFVSVSSPFHFFLLAHSGKCREDCKMSKERKWSVEDTTAISKHYASSDSVYFVSEGRKYLVICDSERHVSVVV